MKIIKKIHNYFIKEVWLIQKDKVHPVLYQIIRFIKVMVITTKEFIVDNVELRASALTFYSLLSVVPVVALAFSIAKGFDMQSMLETLLTEKLSGHEEVLTWVLSMASHMLENSNGGILAGVGIVILLWSVMKLMDNIECAFNNIWAIKTPRTILRKFTDYFAFMFVAPIFLILSSSLNVFIVNFLEIAGAKLSLIGYFIPIILQIIPYILIWILFVLLYMIMPNTKVKFKSALVAGIVAGSIFQLLQWVYIYFQVGVSTYSAIYGSFAALPLFFVWLQMSWLVVLFGAEISFADQNIDKYELENKVPVVSSNNKKMLGLLICRYIIKEFETGSQGVLAYQISQELKIPMRLVKEIISEMVDVGILSKTILDKDKKGYLPAIDIHKIDVNFVMNRLRNKGEDIVEPIDLAEYNNIKTLILEMDVELETSKNNVLLKDI